MHCWVPSSVCRCLRRPYLNMLAQLKRCLVPAALRLTLHQHGNCEPSASNGISVPIERLMQVRSEHASAVELEIDASKDHWSWLRFVMRRKRTKQTWKSFSICRRSGVNLFFGIMVMSWWWVRRLQEGRLDLQRKINI